MAANPIFFGSLELQEAARLEAEKKKVAAAAAAAPASPAAEQRFVFTTTPGGGAGGASGGDDDDDADGDATMVPLGAGGVPPMPALPSGPPGSSSAAAPGDKRETMELSDASKAAQEKHAIGLIQLEAQRRARSMYIPTDSEEIKAELRKAGQPVTLFGEDAYARRERLRRLLAEREVRSMLTAQGLEATAAAAAGVSGAAASSAAAAAAATAAAVATAAVEAASKEEVFYTPAPEGLPEARAFVAAYSFERAAKRLAAQRSVGASPDAQRVEDAHAHRVARCLKRMRPQLSQPADERPMSCVGVSRDGTLVATGSWGPVVKVWDGATAEVRAVLRGHSDRVVATAWHPSAGLGGGAGDPSAGHGSAHSGLETGSHAAHGASAGLLATGSVDGTAKLWRLPAEALVHTPPGRLMTANGGAAANKPIAVPAGAGGSGMDVDGAAAAPPGLTPQQLTETGIKEAATLTGHSMRLCSVAWHPSGRYVGTSSFDRTWRLWDAETGRELQLQEGHAKEVYALAFHPDGSLVASGDLGGVGRVWDLRSGKAVWPFVGHTKQLLALDWSPDGHTLASGSDDNTVVIWDLRAQRKLYVIPAHSGLVSRVKFAPTSGEYLLTSSYEGTIKAWSARDWSPLGTLSGHEGKVTGIDIAAGDETRVVSVGFDRTLKVWAQSEF